MAATSLTLRTAEPGSDASPRTLTSSLPSRSSIRAKAPALIQSAPPAVRLNGNSSNAGASGSSASGGGVPLPPATRKALEGSFKVSLASVRVHTDANAQRLVKNLSGRAFTIGNHIFLGPGEQATDLGLMAHEVTHVVQQQGAPIVQRSAPGQTDSYEREAEQSSAAVLQRAPFTVHERTSGRRLQGLGWKDIKGAAGAVGSAIGGAVSATVDAVAEGAKKLGIGKALDYFAGKANLIPGFRMFTVILGVNPINMSKVDRSAANILRALIEVMPGGTLITDALQNHGVFDKVGKWVEQQIQTLGMVGSNIKKSVTDFLNSLGLTDLADLGGVWDRAKRIFTDPIDRITTFAKGLVTDIVKFIKDAILMPLAKMAAETRGWDLLTAILEKNPITGEAVPRNAETLIGGFMKLIDQPEVWENIQKAKAIPRAWAWFQGALAGLMGFVNTIPTKVINTFKSLTILDIVTVAGAFRKIVGAFVNIATDFITWGVKQVLSLLEILVDVLAPKVKPYIAKARTAFNTILKDPVGFVGNLVRAGKKGFEMFASRILEHLKTALIKWITGPLGEAGVYIPKSFSLIEIVKLVLSVLGLTWENIRKKLVKIIPDPVLTGLEKTARILVTLVKDGPAAAWEEIKTELNELKDQLIAQVSQMVTTEVVKAAVVKIVSMLNPAGAVIQAILAIYNTVTFFIEKIQQLAAVVASFIDSISAIAAGQIDDAAKKVEQTLANTLTVVIAFLAKFAGAGNVPTKVVAIIKKIRDPIDRGLDKIVGWLGNLLKKLVGAAKAGAQALFSWAFAKSSFTEAGGKSHSIYVEGDAEPRLMIASDPKAAEAFLDWYLGTKKPAFLTKKKEVIGQIRGHIKKAKAIAKDIAGLKTKGDAWKARQQEMLAKNVELSGALSKLVGDDPDIAKAIERYKLEGMTGTYGSIPKPPGDDFTADHQPQAAVLIAASKFKFFSKDGELQERAEGRAHKGFAINLYKVRHVAGATYGYKGKDTKESFLARVKLAVKDKPAADQRRAVIVMLKAELRRDAAAIKSAVKAKHDAPVWKDVVDTAGDDKSGKKLVDEIKARILAGEDQVANQDLDSLAD
jgi:hypothetical protein